MTDTDLSSSATPVLDVAGTPVPSACKAQSDRSVNPNGFIGAPKGADQTAEETLFWLTLRDRQLLAIGLCIAATLFAWQLWQAVGGGLKPPTVIDADGRSVVYRLDLNRATWVELMQLEGLGERLARRIVDYRTEHGPFATIEGVQQVPGIGPAKFETLRPYLFIAENVGGTP